MRKQTVCLFLFVSLFVSILPVLVHVPLVRAWNGTIYIYPDGSVNPTSAPIHRDGDIYTLTDNVVSTGDGIIIERNSTIFDGNGYSIQGSLSGNGIDMSQTNYVTAKNANLQGFYIGIFAPKSDFDTVLGNTIAQNSYLGIYVDGSSDNNIICNNIQQNGFGVWLTTSSNINVYHNNFVNNAVQVYTDTINTWDLGYPIGGNYWSDYAGSDLYSGPFQNQTGSDGIGDTTYTIDLNNVDNYPLISPLIHDVGMTNVSASKTVVGQGLTINMSVQVINYGAQTETLYATLNAGSTIINTWVEILPAQSSESLNYTWNTSGIPKGNYTIRAFAQPVSGETLTADNNFTDGWVIVSLVGDLTGTVPNVPDGKCDIRDIAFVAKCFGSVPGSPGWNANCDVNNDGKVDIRDIAIVAKHFGEAG